MFYVTRTPKPFAPNFSLKSYPKEIRQLQNINKNPQTIYYHHAPHKTKAARVRSGKFEIDTYFLLNFATLQKCAVFIDYVAAIQSPRLSGVGLPKLNSIEEKAFQV